MAENQLTLFSPTKRCSRCGEAKELEHFYSKDPRCRSCENRRSKEKAKRNTEKNKVSVVRVAEKVCSRCRIPKRAQEFYQRRDTASGLSPHCKDCEKISRQVQYARHREKRLEASRKRHHQIKDTPEYKEQRRRWYGTNRESVYVSIHKRRDRKKNTPRHLIYTPEQWCGMLDFYGCCLACGTTEKLSVDHVVPLSKGGLNSIVNIQPLCRSCNSKKRTKDTDHRDPYLHSELMFALEATGLL